MLPNALMDYENTLATPAERWDAATPAMQDGTIMQRRACALVGVDLQWHSEAVGLWRRARKRQPPIRRTSTRATGTASSMTISSATPIRASPLSRAFAIGDEVGATLEETMIALVAGYEAYVRIGKHGSPAILNVGWQPHAVFANFGAAAFASRLYGFTEEHTFHGLALALSHASVPRNMPRPAAPSSACMPASRSATELNPRFAY